MFYFDLLRFLFLACHVNAQVALNWTLLAELYNYAYLAQSELLGQVPIDQVTSFGVSVNNVIFNRMGYTFSAVWAMQKVLSLLVSVLTIDVYWNEFTSKWQLCPAPFPRNMTTDGSNTANLTWLGQTYSCQLDLAPIDVFNAIGQFLEVSNTQLDANYIQVGINPKVISIRDHPINANKNTLITPSITDFDNSIPAAGNSSLTDFIGTCASYLYYPSTLQSNGAVGATSESNLYGSKYPTRNGFIFKLYCRIIIYLMSSPDTSGANPYQLTNIDRDTFFISNNNFSPWFVLLDDADVISTIQKSFTSEYNSSYFSLIAHNTHFRLAFDNEDKQFTNDSLNFFAKSGFTPVLNSSALGGNYAASNDTGVYLSMNTTLPGAFWSWAPGQPPSNTTNSTDLARAESSDNDNPQWAIYSETQVAFRCVSIEQEGWVVHNCYDQFRFACKNATNPFDWTLSEKVKTYFAAASDVMCPEGFNFSVPKLSLEQYSLISLLKSTNVLYPVWIDLNDIYVPDCYVTGGPYAVCPHGKILTTNILIKRLAPSLVISLVLIILIFAEHVFTRVPIQSNRTRHWRKTIAQYYKENDFEGVPS